MKCSRCSVAEISPLTGACELCGFVPGTTVAVEHADALVELATRQLAHEFSFVSPVAISPHSALLRAREVSTNSEILLKVIPRLANERDEEESFRATLGAVAAVDHPHIVPVLRYGSTDSLFWYTTPDSTPTSLRAMLHEKGPLDARTCRRVLTQVVSALEYLHRHGVVHGAIKPENVLIDRDGWVSIADPAFRRLRPVRASRTLPAKSGVVEAEADATIRPSWIAPEDQARGERLPAADQYALAALAYECLTGRAPGARPDPVLKLRPDASIQTARAVERALSEEPRQRFPSCADFLWALEESSGGQDVARPVDRVAQEVVMIEDWTPPDDPRRHLFIAAWVVLGLGIAIALFFGANEILRILRRQPSAEVADATPATRPTTEAATDVAAAPESMSTAAASTPARPVTPRAAPRAAPPSRAASGSSAATTPPAAAPSAATAPAATTTAPSGSAKLFVNASPWGQVFLDGILVGNTPKANVDVSAGAHLVRVVRPGYVPFERTIRVTAGETVRLTDIVLLPVQP
ncbi:MAG: serine/threonine protein kinase [Gemmatimonadaceae bacterium]